MAFLTEILNWSEVWALLIPLGILLIYRHQPKLLHPVVVYLWIALVINLFIDVIAMFYLKWNFPYWLRTNNYLYNIHSIARFICFSWFFRKMQRGFTGSKVILPVLAAVFLFIN